MYWAKCVELDSCFTQGKTLDDLKENMREALNLYLDEPSNSKAEFAPPMKIVKGRNIVAVSVDPKIAFAHNLRHFRTSRGLTQKEAAQRLGFKNLFSYQRLEFSKTANPELMTLAKIKELFPEFDLDEVVGQ
ncbi:MAG: type II toxin-antitoxin system HicB family antitoxin [Proteobacteria bacterium]|nr:type II toxin-antitoxin system HicB family antitoxin [Pseudomonadota bacterium]